MVNTYTDSATSDERIAEELRLIRCILERWLNFSFPKAFLDYQMEKFGKDYKIEVEKKS